MTPSPANAPTPAISRAGATTITVAVWVALATSMGGCVTAHESRQTTDLTQASLISSEGSGLDTPDQTTSPPESVPTTSSSSMTADVSSLMPASQRPAEPTWEAAILSSVVASCTGSRASERTIGLDPACDQWLISPLGERPSDNDMPLRPPLRRLWFNHPRLVPLGDNSDFDLPKSEILAHQDHFRSGPFRNPYAGLRDQPLLHRDTTRDPVSNSTLPEIGPPPPKHSIKTLLTLGGLSLVGAGVYAFAPSSFVGGNKQGQWEDAWGHFKEAWTKPPVFDKDPAIVNYMGHPYFGANFYLAARNYGESPLYSFLFSVFCSTFFEYMIESWSERPSVNDLIVTPVVGSILGELIFIATQKMREDGFTTPEKIVVTIINPLYVLQNGYR